ncbi:MAG: hypothetical protein QM764_00665 [Chitinophagaceae bacterium]
MTKEQIQNLMASHAKPRVIAPINIHGFSLTTARSGEQFQIIQKGAFTAFDPNFHVYAEQILRIIGSKGNWNLLIRIDSAETKIYEDNLPISLQVRAKKKMEASAPVFEGDIADIESLSFKDSFEDINPLEGEKVLCILSIDYLHGLYFDLTGKLKTEEFQKDLGRLYRHLRYFNVYNALANGDINQLTTIGWFPFIQLLDGYFNVIVSLVRENKLNQVDSFINEKFTNERVSELTKYWEEHSSFQKKKQQITEGLECFLEGSFAACISTLTPLIEGVFNDYLLTKTGKGLSYKGDDIADAIYKTASTKTDDGSLLLPADFRDYLIKHFFKNMKASTSNEATRHVVGHGRAEDIAFTRERSLQIILTLDQLFFYMDKQS